MKKLLLIFLLQYVCNYALSEPSGQDLAITSKINIPNESKINIPNESKNKALDDPTEKMYKKVTPLKPRIKSADPKYVTYTAFPKAQHHENIKAPLSLFFSAEKHTESKVRVKKVLPGNYRRKRDITVGKAYGKPSEPNKARRRRKNKSRRSNGKSRRGGGKKDSANETRKMTHSKDAVIEDYPYVVSIQKTKVHWCSGAILNQRLVITTANCVWKADRLSRLMIRAGSRDATQGGQIAYIQELFKHPLWSIRSKPDCDVALLMLDRFLKFSHKIHAVDLPNRMMMPAFEDVWVTSWGAERGDGMFEPSSTMLQAHHVKLIGREDCNRITLRYGVRVTHNFFCVTQSGGVGPCTRDTGAPAVSDGILWGLASWGIRKKCGTNRFPAMYSYLASDSNMDFIINATRFLMSESRVHPFLDQTKGPDMIRLK